MMPNEIEDRFLVFSPPVVTHLTPAKIIQGYLETTKNLNVRIHKGAVCIKGKNLDFKYQVPDKDLKDLEAAFQGDVRIRTVDDQTAFLTIKGKKVGNTAPEFEYPIAIEQARDLHKHCGTRIITKDRYEIIGADAHKWELDFFTGRHAGLIITELELPDKHTKYLKPDWLGPEVTQDKRFTNASLARNIIKDIMKWVGEYLPKTQGPSRPAPSP